MTLAQQLVTICLVSHLDLINITTEYTLDSPERLSVIESVSAGYTDDSVVVHEVLSVCLSFLAPMEKLAE